MKQVSKDTINAASKVSKMTDIPDGVARSQAMIEFDIRGTILTATPDFVLAVKDYGPGFDFETTTGNIGLAIIANLVRKDDGKVKYDRSQGMKVSITLPTANLRL